MQPLAPHWKAGEWSQDKAYIHQIHSAFLLHICSLLIQQTCILGKSALVLVLTMAQYHTSLYIHGIHQEI